MLKIIWVQVW